MMTPPISISTCEAMVLKRPSVVPGWVLLALVLTLIAVARIEDVAVVAQWLDSLIGKAMRSLSFTKTVLEHDSLTAETFGNRQ
jgi:hypothetical protein